MFKPGDRIINLNYKSHENDSRYKNVVSGYYTGTIISVSNKIYAVYDDFEINDKEKNKIYEHPLDCTDLVTVEVYNSSLYKAFTENEEN